MPVREIRHPSTSELDLANILRTVGDPVRLEIVRALSDAAAAGVEVTDEAMAMERQGQRPLLVEGSEDNFTGTTPADLDRFEFVLSRRAG